MPTTKPNMFASASARRKEEQKELEKKALNKENLDVNSSKKVNNTPKINTKKKINSNGNTKKNEESPKAGRPKGKPSTKISLNVPDEYLELVNIAAGINYKGNTSSYIVSLIEKDLKENGKAYEAILKLK